MTENINICPEAAVETNSSAGHKCPASEKLNRMIALCELAKATLFVHDFDELLRKISEETAKQFNATGCMIRLIEDDKLRIKASYGLPEEMAEDVTVSIGEGIAGMAASEGRTIIAKSPEEFGFIAPNITIQTAICTPLKIDEQIIGTFGLYDKKLSSQEQGQVDTIIPFTEDDVITFENFASIAAIAIDKSILCENALRKEREAVEAREKGEELKNYLFGLIENTADAIVSSDLNGIITSWNIGAERIYGYSREEAMDRFLPFVPDFLVHAELALIERVKMGETIKDLETFRRTRDGNIIDINLTLSPIKDSAGSIIGISGIARDITEKKKTEKELIKTNDMLSRLYFIGSAMRGTLELDKMLRMVLTAVTMGDGLGFNRAMLLLVEDGFLKGAMGVGPASYEEAWEIWSRLSAEQKNLHSLMEEIENVPPKKDFFMDRLCCGVNISLQEDTILTKAVKEKKAFNVPNVYSEPLSDPLLIQQLGTMAYAVIPLISRDRAIGVLWVDNMFSGRVITSTDMEFLKGFSDQISSAIENARLFEQVFQAEQELENIFESISDLVYFNSSDYTIKRVNKAVVEKIGKPMDEIVGEKCYKIFHGMDEPWNKCPHHKTLSVKKPFVEEIEDPALGGSFLISSSPIFDKSGLIIGTVHIARDITESIKMREKVASAERMASLGEMAAKVAHEIRNPLLSIGGFARRLETKLSGNLREYSRIIVEEVNRLEDILSDTLSFVRTTKIEKKKVDLNELVDNIMTLLEPAIYERGNVLLKDAEYPVNIYTDYNKFKEALLNILGNANQATDNGTIIIRTHNITSHRDEDLFGNRIEEKTVLVEIEDNGCGIKESDINRIFDPFFTTRPAGTGLGLSITKRIIEELDFKIEVESQWGKGTKFKISIPVQEEEI